MLRLIVFLSAFFLASAAAASTLWVNAPRDGYLNLRQGPSVQYHVLGKMPHGTKVTVLKAPGKWIKVRHASGHIGWAHSGFLSHHKPAMGHGTDHGAGKGQPFWVDAPRHGQLNLRTGPGRHYHVIAKIPHGARTRVIQKQDGWYKLRFDGKTGWANSRFLSAQKITAHDQGQPYWIDMPRLGWLPLRTGPGRGYHMIDKMPHGSQARVIYKQDGWYKLRFGGQTGWANSRFLSAHKVSGLGYKGGYDRDHDNGFTSAPIPNPTGQTYWVYAPGFDGLNLRAGPGTGHSVLFTMQPRDKVVKLGRQGKWIHLRHQSSGKTGWAHGDYLVKQDPGFAHHSGDDLIYNDKTHLAGHDRDVLAKETSHKENGKHGHKPDHKAGKKGGHKADKDLDVLAKAFPVCASHAGADLKTCVLRSVLQTQ